MSCLPGAMGLHLGPLAHTVSEVQQEVLAKSSSLVPKGRLARPKNHVPDLPFSRFTLTPKSGPPL